MTKQRNEAFEKRVQKMVEGKPLSTVLGKKAGKLHVKDPNDVETIIAYEEEMTNGLKEHIPGLQFVERRATINSSGFFQPNVVYTAVINLEEGCVHKLSITTEQSDVFCSIWEVKVDVFGENFAAHREKDHPDLHAIKQTFVEVVGELPAYRLPFITGGIQYR